MRFLLAFLVIGGLYYCDMLFFMVSDPWVASGGGGCWYSHLLRIMTNNAVISRPLTH